MNNKLFRKIAIGAAVLALWAAQLACGPDGGTVKTITVTIDNANTSCNDITSCVGKTPQELANLCSVAGGYHDANGTCVMP